MKIPTYRKQVSYRRAVARDVALAQPLAEASGHGGVWLDAAEALGSLTAGVGRMMIRQKKEAEREAAQGGQQPSGPKSKKKPQQPPSAQPPSTDSSGFASQERMQMLAYCRTKAFEDVSSGETAQEKLDAYFEGLHPSVGQAGKEDLLTQDYVVMRKEVERLSAARLEREEEQRFNEGAGHFVQTAAMVRTPRALDEYISSNLSAAKEASSMSVGAWDKREQTLRTAAVRHNIEAALGAREPEQAAAVLAHFEKNFSEKEREVLADKVARSRAESAAKYHENAAYEACRSEEGELDEKKLLSWTKENIESSGVRNEEFFSALKARLADRERGELRRRAQAYERLASCEAEESSLALAASSCADKSEYERRFRAVQALRSEPQRSSDRAVFNTLYERVSCGDASEKELDGAFEKGDLSARDYLRLKSASCLRRAGDGDARERLLGCAAADLCRGRSEKETEEIKYFIFSSPGGVEGKLQAALQAKRILNLQETNA